MSLILALAALGVLILVHELGHFVAAKLSGIYVEKFSIGMGPKLVSFTKGETEYMISAVPLGGYVKLHRMFEDEEAIAGKEKDAFFNKPVHKKLFVITAGVLCNVIFAFFLFIVIYLAGYKAYSPLVGTVSAASAAEKAGILKNDKILAVNSEKVRTWDEFENFAGSAFKEGKTIELSIERNGGIIRTNLEPVPRKVTNIFGEEVTIPYYGMDNFVKPYIGEVLDKYPAKEAGLKAGDLITAVNGNKVEQWAEVGSLVQTDKENVRISVMRDGRKLDFVFVPQIDNRSGQIRVMAGIGIPNGDLVVRDSFGKAIKDSLRQTVSGTRIIYKGIIQTIRGKISKDDIGGPIMIVQATSQSVKSGYEVYLSFVAMISLNLAVLNLLPLPVLDGGYVVMYIYEAIARRRVSVKARNFAQRIGVILLAMLMVFAFYNDITRFFK